METVRVVNASRESTLCQSCGVANNLFTRVRGLLGRTSLPEGEGLLIEPCPSIHMFGMKFSLDVIFLTKEHVVTDYVENIPPGKYYVAKNQHGKAHSALELPVGVIAGSGTQRGDRLSFE